MTTTFDELAREVLRFRDEREWARFHTPKNLAMGLGIEAGEGDFFTGAVTSREWLALGARILRNVPVDWRSAGVTTDEDFAGLAEVLMRLFLSFLRSPSTPPHTDDQLRELVRRWIGPALDPRG